MCLSFSVYAACSAKKAHRQKIEASPSGATRKTAEKTQHHGDQLGQAG